MYNNKDITFTIETDDTLYFDFDNQIHDYLTAINKPSINGHTLIGDMTLEDLGLELGSSGGTGTIDNTVASYNQLGKVKIKKDGGITIDEDGYIAIDEKNDDKEYATLDDVDLLFKDLT